MGADISVDGKVAVVEGTGKLTGAPVKACDLRAGAALIVAGLAAHGVTEIEDIYHIERGYANLDAKLRQIGADIQKVSDPAIPAKLKEASKPKHHSKCKKPSASLAAFLVEKRRSDLVEILFSVQFQ